MHAPIFPAHGTGQLQKVANFRPPLPDADQHQTQSSLLEEGHGAPRAVLHHQPQLHKVAPPADRGGLGLALADQLLRVHHINKVSDACQTSRVVDAGSPHCVTHRPKQPVRLGEGEAPLTRVRCRSLGAGPEEAADPHCGSFWCTGQWLPPTGRSLCSCWRLPHPPSASPACQGPAPSAEGGVEGQRSTGEREGNERQDHRLAARLHSSAAQHCAARCVHHR
mmetsp:Transcript_52910/g.150793  ORF Transcript_52910/g.150793 Transcript_52910/m.150793 type:complete len:222 (+) Transcript_52910:69-734(+)